MKFWGNIIFLAACRSCWATYSLSRLLEILKPKKAKWSLNLQQGNARPTPTTIECSTGFVKAWYTLSDTCRWLGYRIISTLCLRLSAISSVSQILLWPQYWIPVAWKGINIANLTTFLVTSTMAEYGHKRGPKAPRRMGFSSPSASKSQLLESELLNSFDIDQSLLRSHRFYTIYP